MDQNGYTIVGQSFDDNVSGMKFGHCGLDELTAAVDTDKIDAVIIKGHEAKAKNVGVEETGPRRPHFVVTEKNSGAGAGD